MYLPNGTGIFYIDVYKENGIVEARCDFDDIVSAYDSGALLAVRDFRDPKNMNLLHLYYAEEKHVFYFSGFSKMEVLMLSEYGVTVQTYGG